MIAKLLSSAMIAGLLFSVTAPMAQAADAPKTKAACMKVKDMKWDATAKKCVHK
jgi:hypothetical protein